jgi:hypothetical protein
MWWTWRWSGGGQQGRNGWIWLRICERIRRGRGYRVGMWWYVTRIWKGETKEEYGHEKRTFVLQRFLAAPSSCTAPHRTTLFYLWYFTLARIHTVVCMVMSLRGLVSGYRRFGEALPSSRWKFTAKVEVVWFPFW